MFKNLTIKARLVGVLGFLALLLVVLGVLGLSGMSRTNDGLRTVYEDRTVPMKDLAEIDAIAPKGVAAGDRYPAQSMHTVHR